MDLSCYHKMAEFEEHTEHLELDFTHRNSITDPSFNVAHLICYTFMYLWLTSVA